MKKRILSLVLALCLVLTLIPAMFVPAAVASGEVAIGFEAGTTQGFVNQDNSVKITVTDEAARTGTKSLLVTNRSVFWHGAHIVVDNIFELNCYYEIIAWVRQKSPGNSHFVLEAQHTPRSTGERVYHRVDGKDASGTDEWVKLTGLFMLVEPSDHILIQIYNENPTAEFFIDDFSVTPLRYIPENIKRNTGLPSLKDTYKDYFMLGSIFIEEELYDDLGLEFVKRHFNILTMGELKSYALTSGKGQYSFSHVDETLDVMNKNDILLHGHTLIWDQASAPWLNENSDGTPLTRAEAIANMTEYINTVAGHLRGQVLSWDVVNEAFDALKQDLAMLVARDWRNGLKYNSSWYQAFANGADKSKGESGADYIEYAFRLARAADPSAVLYYNADMMYMANSLSLKQSHYVDIAVMVKDINDRWLAEGNTRLLIEGVGLQGALVVGTSPADMEAAIKCLIDTGVEISISEILLPLDFHWIPSAAAKEITPELLERQARLYAELFIIYKKYSDKIARVSFWGVNDRSCWMMAQYPLLFDDYYNPKLAYFAVADPEGYLAGKFNTAEKRQAWIDAGGKHPADPSDPLSTASDWARADLTTAIAKGFIPTDLQGSYQNTITRAEFCRLAVKWLEYKTGKRINVLLSEKGLEYRQDAFSDTTNPEILAAYALGIIGGAIAPTATAPGVFNPNSGFTREMAATLIRNVCREAGIDISNVSDQGYTDINSAADYAVDGINFVRANGIMGSTNTNPLTFSPKISYTREQSIITFSNIK